MDIADILAQCPEWDKGTHRLAMPTLILLNNEEIPSSADHLSPKYLKDSGIDYTVKNVTLLTCWRRGCAMAEAEYAPAATILQAADQDPSIDLLSPNGTLLVEANLPQDDVDESSEALALNANQPAETPPAQSEGEAQVDVEGELGETSQQPSGSTPAFDHNIMINRKLTSKAKALAMVSRYRKTVGLTDRLKQVQKIECYMASQAATTVNYEGEGQILLIHDPITTLVWAEDKLWLAIGEVNGIKYEKQGVDRIGHGILGEPGVKVLFQLVGLRLTMSDDSQPAQYEWRTYGTPGRSYEVPGRYLEPLDPELSTQQTSGRPFYLFQTEFLLATSAMLAQCMKAADAKHFPKLVVTTEFPYRERFGKTFSLAADMNIE